MKTFLLSSIALVALTGTALAADLPSRRAPPVYVPPPIPVFSWTGFYVGGQIGFGFGQDTIRRTVPAAGLSVTDHPNGIVGGGHLGYNFATTGFGAGGLILGVEGDIDGSDYRNSFGALTTIRNEIQGSARARVGFAVDRALFYATGGAAFAQFQTTYVGGPALSSTRVGWTVGGGVEYAVTTQWSLRGEYRYSDFGTFQNNIGRFAFSRNETMERVQVGFSYKFDAPAAVPVVARY